MGDDLEKYFLPKYVPAGYLILKLSQMTGKSATKLIDHWIYRLNGDHQPFRFKDLSPKIPFKKYNRSTVGNPSSTSKFIDIDSSDDEVSNKQSKSGKTTISNSTRSKPVSTPPTSDDDADLETTPKPKPKPMPKITIPSPGNESDDSVPMLKIGPPKKSARKEPQPKKSAPMNKGHPTPKPKALSPEHSKPIDGTEALQKEIKKKPIGLSGPAQNNDDDSTRSRFLRTLSCHPTFQQLIRDVRSLPNGPMTLEERQQVPKWSSWDQPKHYIPTELHLDQVKYNKFLTWMMEEPYRYGNGKLLRRTAAEHWILAIGMALRDVNIRDHIPND
jgi:hypothetical protein